MNTTPHLSNSAIPVARDDLERILQSLIATQEASGLAASIIIDRLNEVDGNPDTEDDDPDEVQGDERDCAWIEWDKMAPTMRGVGNVMGVNNEDAEDDDAAEDDDPPEEDDHSGQCSEDEISTGPGHWGGCGSAVAGPGCPLSDPGGPE